MIIIIIITFISSPAEKAQQYLVAEGDDGVNQPEYLRKARKSFCTIITRINNSSNTIGKDGKVETKKNNIFFVILNSK